MLQQILGTVQKGTLLAINSFLRTFLSLTKEESAAVTARKQAVEEVLTKRGAFLGDLEDIWYSRHELKPS